MIEFLTADEWNARQQKSNNGRAAQAGGRAFEQDLEYTHDYYRKVGKADIIKLPVPTSPMPRNWLRNPKERGPIARILSARQRADYMGTVNYLRMNTISAGKGPIAKIVPTPIAMEAKANRTKRIASLRILKDDEKGHGLKIHQLESLVEGWRTFGTLGVVVWLNGPELRGVLMPDVLERVHYLFTLGREHLIPWSHATPYSTIRPERSDFIEDWLTPVVEWAGHNKLAAKAILAANRHPTSGESISAASQPPAAPGPGLYPFPHSP